MWVCRAGKNAEYLKSFLNTSRIYLVWEGFDADLSSFDDMDLFRELVIKEKETDNKTSVSNWAGQLRAFSRDMNMGDYVLVPDACSQHFMLAQLKGEYEYSALTEVGFFHSRKVDIIARNIPKKIFPQHIQYGLRAYRTVYKVKNEEEILKIINLWREKERLS